MGLPTLVARTTRLRLPLWRNHLPRIASDSPPACPGTQREYTSAVSTKFIPASTQASRRRNDIDSSTVQPKTLPPRQIRETSRPERPSGRSEEEGMRRLLQGHADRVGALRAPRRRPQPACGCAPRLSLP